MVRCGWASGSAAVMRLPTPEEGPGAARRWYDWNSGLPIGTVFSLLPDAHGQALAATSRGLFTLRGERWAAVGEDEGLPSGPANGLAMDSGQTVWVLGQGGRWYRRVPGAARFEYQPAMDDISDLASGPDGQLWLLDKPPPGCG